MKLSCLSLSLPLSVSLSLFPFWKFQNWLNITPYNSCLFGMKFISCLFHYRQVTRKVFHYFSLLNLGQSLIIFLIFRSIRETSFLMNYFQIFQQILMIFFIFGWFGWFLTFSYCMVFVKGVYLLLKLKIDLTVKSILN